MTPFRLIMALAARDLRRLFLRKLRASLPDISPDWPAVRREILERARAALDPAGKDGWDAPAHYHAAIAALVLGAYETLEARGLPANNAFDAVNTALVDAYRARLAAPVRFGFWLNRRPLPSLRRMVAWGWLQRASLGNQFEMTATGAEDRAELAVHRCFYHDFFADKNLPQLTAIICHSDFAWIDALNASPANIAFDRPSTIGWGGEHCLFRFTPRR